MEEHNDNIKQSVENIEMENKSFKFGDLIIKCHQCGETQLLESMITEGRAIYLFPHEDSHLRLECSNCKTCMEMRMVPTIDVDEEIENISNDEEFQEESTEAEIV